MCAMGIWTVVYYTQVFLNTTYTVVTLLFFEVLMKLSDVSKTCFVRVFLLGVILQKLARNEEDEDLALTNCGGVNLFLLFHSVEIAYTALHKQPKIIIIFFFMHSSKFRMLRRNIVNPQMHSRIKTQKYYDSSCSFKCR